MADLRGGDPFVPPPEFDLTIRARIHSREGGFRMRVRTSFSAWSLGLILVLAAHAQTAHAQAAGLSDRFSST